MSPKIRLASTHDPSTLRIPPEVCQLIWPAIDKERKFISNLRWNMPVFTQTVPSVPLQEQLVLAH